MFQEYVRLLSEGWLGIALCAVVPPALFWAGGRYLPSWPRLAVQRRRLSLALLLVAVAAGLFLALRVASVVDDAFISFRFARNFADGKGLVFNEGEFVEGYTNFLWTFLLGVVHWVSRVDLPTLSLGFSLASFVASLVVVYRLGAHLAHDWGCQFYVPVASGLLALQSVFVSFSTTGLETMFATFLVLSGAWFFVTRQDRRGAFLSGALLILATFCRPDHSIFYVVGGLSWMLRLLPRWLRGSRSLPALWSLGGKELLAYCAPFVVYALYLGWKLLYYGDVLPNTFYAKSADLAYWRAGGTYLSAFLLASHHWVLVPLLVPWVWLPSASEAHVRLKIFGVLSMMAFGGYVFRIGGDFMHGRFFVVLMPFILLGAEGALHATVAAYGKAPRAIGATLVPLLMLGLLTSTARDLRLIQPRKIRWGLADEATFYPVTWRYPLGVRHDNYETGTLFGRVLRDRGIEVALATSGIGMVGFYSRLPLVDMLGLTDPVVARAPVGRRRRPGHEKRATLDYLLSRDVRFFRKFRHDAGHYIPPDKQHLAELDLGRRLTRPWFLLTYDRALMDRVRRQSPEVGFVDFEDYLDRYIAGLDSRSAEELSADLSWFRRYYFDHNDDPARLSAIEQKLHELEGHRPIAEPGSTGTPRRN